MYDTIFGKYKVTARRVKYFVFRSIVQCRVVAECCIYILLFRPLLLVFYDMILGYFVRNARYWCTSYDLLVLLFLAPCNLASIDSWTHKQQQKGIDVLVLYLSFVVPVLLLLLLYSAMHSSMLHEYISYLMYKVVLTGMING